ncbi:outer membrane protein [Sphingomonas bacterium]|uniref:outer membrane protein n=1 Tax=Sphingomonas bacterium TaxID=1895847 RepID=UPI0020C61EFB|nr:outer membrane beta-barrel protein [Sphingomonas bacterium]
MRHPFALPALAGLIVAAPAFAQAAPAPAPAPAPAQDMAAPAPAQDAPAPASQDGTIPTPPARPIADTLRGFRIEGNAGGDRFRSQGQHRDKFGYGATIGFDGLIGDRIVVGPEASYWRANNYTEICTPGGGGGTLCNKSFDEYSVGVRAGLLLAPQLLIFGKGGYVLNEQRKRFTAPTPQASYYDHYNTEGYQVGGGVELSMADRFKGPLAGLYVNAQYVYSDYYDHSSRQRVMGGIGIHFK